MSSIDEKIDNALGITHDIAQQLVHPKPIVRRPDEDSDHADVDYKYSRENFYNLVERGQDAIDGILGQLIKNVSEETEKLVDLQEKMKKLKEVPDNAPKNVTNALFVGSTKELQNLLKDKSNGTDIKLQR